MAFQHLKITICVVSLFISSLGHAYNFLETHPDTGQPLGWEPGSTITYYVDRGRLGRLENWQLLVLIREAMNVWENASPYANPPRFEFGGCLPERDEETRLQEVATGRCAEPLNENDEINDGNHEEYVVRIPCYENQLNDSDRCTTRMQRELKTIIAFDETGTIIEENCIQDCGAFAGPTVISGDFENPNNFLQSTMVLGPNENNSRKLINAVFGTILHEVGHMFGLAHTSINQSVYIEGEDSGSRYMPTMFFYPIRLQRNQSRATLHPDDRTGLEVLYPNDSLAENTGSLSGEIFLADGSPIKHLNVIARNVEDPWCEAFSFLIGRYCNHFIFRCREEDNRFFITGLPPGNYTLEVEEIADEDLAATLAPVVSDVTITQAEFWNEDDQVDEENTVRSGIIIAAGESVENIIIHLSDSAELIPYISFDFLQPPEGETWPSTECPTEPETNYATLINFDESPPPSSGGDSGGDAFAGSASGCSLIPPRIIRD